MLENIARTPADNTERLQVNLERNRSMIEVMTMYWPDEVTIVLKAFKDRGVE